MRHASFFKLFGIFIQHVRLLCRDRPALLGPAASLKDVGELVPFLCFCGLRRAQEDRSSQASQEGPVVRLALVDETQSLLVSYK